MSTPIKKPPNRFFPHGGNRSSEKHWNDNDNRKLNSRRLRIDPLKDGYDSPDEDPTRVDGPDPKKGDIPI